MLLLFLSSLPWGIVTLDMLVCHLKMRSAHVSSLECIMAIVWMMLQGLYRNGFLLRKKPIKNLNFGAKAA